MSILFWHVVVSVKLAVKRTRGCGGSELATPCVLAISFALRFERAVWLCLGSSLTRTKKFTKKLQLQSDFYFSSYLAHLSVLINQEFYVLYVLREEVCLVSLTVFLCLTEGSVTWKDLCVGGKR